MFAASELMASGNLNRSRKYLIRKNYRFREFGYLHAGVLQAIYYHVIKVCKTTETCDMRGTIINNAFYTDIE